MSKVLILGDGRLGSELHKQRPDWDILSRKTNPDFNIDEINSFNHAQLLHKYDTIINCIAYTNTTDNNKNKHWETNYKFAIDLTDYCNKNLTKLIHISSDYIYSQSKSEASEDDIPVHLPTWYCYTKLLVDAYVEVRSENYLIIRTSFKERPWIHDNAWVDLKGNFDYTDVIAKQIIFLIENDAKGIYNVGTGLKTIYELAKQTKPDVKENSWEDNQNHIRPIDISMNLKKFEDFIEKNYANWVLEKENIEIINSKSTTK